MKKVDDGEETGGYGGETRKNSGKIMLEIVAANVVASQLRKGRLFVPKVADACFQAGQQES